MRRSALLLLAAACTANKQAATSSVPSPLAAALIDDRASPARSSPIISVDRLPPGFPATLVPSAPARIVGGMTSGDEIVAVFADSTRRLSAVLEQLFVQAGFTRPPETPSSGFSPASGPYSYFCGDSGTVSVEPLMGVSRTFARVRYRPTRTWSCRPATTSHSTENLILPELKPPVGVHVSRAGGGSGSGDVHSKAEVTGVNLVPSAIVAHYAAQLVAAGWTATPPANGERVAAQFFEAKTASGAAWEGVLLAAGSRTKVTISLNMNPHESP